MWRSNFSLFARTRRRPWDPEYIEALQSCGQLIVDLLRIRPQSSSVWLFYWLLKFWRIVNTSIDELLVLGFTTSRHRQETFLDRPTCSFACVDVKKSIAGLIPERIAGTFYLTNHFLQVTGISLDSERTNVCNNWVWAIKSNYGWRVLISAARVDFVIIHRSLALLPLINLSIWRLHQHLLAIQVPNRLDTSRNGCHLSWQWRHPSLIMSVVQGECHLHVCEGDLLDTWSSILHSYVICCKEQANYWCQGINEQFDIVGPHCSIK